MSDPAQTACHRLDDAHLYALNTLAPSEATAFEAHLAACQVCRSALDGLAPVIDAFVAWPRDVLRPARPQALWHRIAKRVESESGAGQGVAAVPSSGWREPDWKQVSPGIHVKLLASDEDTHRVSMLVRLEPDTAYPPHRHAGTEELHLLEGVLIVDDRTLFPGDYIRGTAGSSDSRVYSATGCTCVLITSTRDALLS